jgi:hypothetical protein
MKGYKIRRNLEALLALRAHDEVGPVGRREEDDLEALVANRRQPNFLKRVRIRDLLIKMKIRTRKKEDHKRKKSRKELLEQRSPRLETSRKSFLTCKPIV